jgi:predicted TIM-barrel fold metal-dependent hydrolase
MKMEIWDPHFHLWDVSENTLSGHDSSQLFAPNDNPVYSWDLYAQDMLSAGSGFEHTGGAFIEAVSVCHVGVTGDEFTSACLLETSWVSKQLLNSNNCCIIVSSAPLEDANAGKIIAQLAENPRVRGIRQILNHEPSWPRNEQLGDLLCNPKWQDGYAELKKHSFSFDFQLNPHQFKDVVRLVEKHPEIPVIIGHLGSPTLDDLTENNAVYWDGLKAFSDLEKTFIKISMLSYIDENWEHNSLVQETVIRVIDLFGIDRCFFASNFPVEKYFGWNADSLYKAFVNLIDHQYSQKDQQKLFAENAKKAYRIETIQR